MKPIITAALMITLLGCASSKITSSWKAKDQQPVKYNKILVIAVLKDNDAAIRSEMEGHLVGDLTAAGLAAVSATSEYGPKAFVNSDENKVLESIQGKGFDAVMTIVLLNKQQEREYFPGKVIYSPYRIYQDRFWRYYTTMYTRIETEGYYSTTTKYFWESNLYDLAGKKLVYSVQTESFDPATTGSMAHQYGRLIVDDVLKSKILDIPPVK